MAETAQVMVFIRPTGRLLLEVPCPFVTTSPHPKFIFFIDGDVAKLLSSELRCVWQPQSPHQQPSRRETPKWLPTLGKLKGPPNVRSHHQYSALKVQHHTNEAYRCNDTLTLTHKEDICFQALYDICFVHMSRFPFLIIWVVSHFGIGAWHFHGVRHSPYQYPAKSAGREGERRRQNDEAIQLTAVKRRTGYAASASRQHTTEGCTLEAWPGRPGLTRTQDRVIVMMMMMMMTTERNDERNG